MRKESSTNTRNRLALGQVCVVHEALASLSLRWKVPVLHAVAGGVSTYGALQRALPAATDQMLGTRLRELVAEGLLVKKVDRDRAAPTGYAMTTSGREILAIMEDICRWAKRRADGRERGAIGA